MDALLRKKWMLRRNNIPLLVVLLIAGVLIGRKNASLEYYCSLAAMVIYLLLYMREGIRATVVAVKRHRITIPLLMWVLMFMQVIFALFTGKVNYLLVLAVLTVEYFYDKER